MRPRRRHLPSAICHYVGVVLAAALLTTSWSMARVDAANTEITANWDKTFAFAGLRTWAWHPEGQGDVKLLYRAEGDDPKRVASRVDPIIIPAVERELGAIKLTKSEASSADLHVNYYVLVTVGQSAQVAGQFLPSVPEWGIPPFTPQTTALSIYPAGTLIIDVTSPKLKAIVWRGSAARKIELERPDEERRKVLDRAIRDLFKKFPKTK